MSDMANEFHNQVNGNRAAGPSSLLIRAELVGSRRGAALKQPIVADTNVRILSVGKRELLQIERDAEYPQMWRVRLPDGSLTGLVNLTRAKEAALDIAEGIEDRKNPHKSPLKSLKIFSWSSPPVARNGRRATEHPTPPQNTLYGATSLSAGAVTDQPLTGRGPDTAFETSSVSDPQLCMASYNGDTRVVYGIDGLTLARWLRRQSPQARAELAATLVLGKYEVTDLLPAQAARLCNVGPQYLTPSAAAQLFRDLTPQEAEEEVRQTFELIISDPVQRGPHYGHEAY
jgi:hypothetical protein